jgi:hypothetical protein
MNEKWRAIPGWEGYYEASTEGRIRSLARLVAARPWGHDVLIRSRRKERILKGRINKGGYHDLHLKRDGVLKVYATVQSLVALTFIGPRPPGMHVCHNNGDKADNRLENLRYDTPSANVQEAIVSHKTWGVGTTSVHWRSDVDEDALLRLRAKGWTYAELAAQFGIGEATVGRIIKGTRQRG